MARFPADPVATRPGREPNPPKNQKSGLDPPPKLIKRSKRHNNLFEERRRLFFFFREMGKMRILLRGYLQRGWKTNETEAPSFSSGFLAPDTTTYWIVAWPFWLLPAGCEGFVSLLSILNFWRCSFCFVKWLKCPSVLDNFSASHVNRNLGLSDSLFVWSWERFFRVMHHTDTITATSLWTLIPRWLFFIIVQIWKLESNKIRCSWVHGPHLNEGGLVNSWGQDICPFIERTLGAKESF